MSGGPRNACSLTPLSRRQVLLAAAAGLTACVFDEGSKTALAATRTPVREFVLDRATDPVGEFHRAAVRAGMCVTHITGDIGWVAMELDARWVVRPHAVAGVTLPSSLFVLEQIALRHDMTLAFRGEHQYQPDGSWCHSVTFAAYNAACGGALMTGTSWPRGYRGPKRVVSWSFLHTGAYRDLRVCTI